MIPELSEEIMSGLAPSTRRVDGAVQQAQHQELLLALNQLLDQQRAQAALMEGMREEMTGVKRAMEQSQDELRSVQRELSSLRNEVERLRERHGAKESGVELQDDFRDHVDSRLNNLDNRQLYHEMLMKNREWKYPARIPRRFAENAFLKSVKKATCFMRHGNAYSDRMIVHIQGEANFVHHNAFLPHWDEFTHALDQYQYALQCCPDSFSELSIRHVSIPHRVITSLEYALDSTHFTSLTFEGNNFGREGIQFLLRHLRKNHKLNSLTVEGNEFNNEEASQLGEIIEAHPKIESIDLTRCFSDQMTGHNTLCSIMSAGVDKLKCIDFSGNAIATEGNTFIADYLAKNTILENLIIEGNHFVDEDVQLIAGALKSNTNLRFLDVSSSESLVTTLGTAALANAEFDRTNLNSAADSNHTCCIVPLEFSQFQEEGDDPKVVRGTKIFDLLSSRHRTCSNVMDWDNIPVELLPDMISSIQRNWEYSKDFWDSKYDIKPLSIVFEMLRRWDRAFSVFESLSAAVLSQVNM
ncbi:hypothetical protein ACHAWF_017351 [Thalassiosira exigua]